MALKNSKVIMAKNIRLEKDYTNVLSYNTASMVALCTANAVQTFNHCMFLRPGENSFQLDMTYDNAFKCNYVAFQNPDYSNKWFFAFIDSVEYISDGNTKINYTVDEFSTWWDYWQPDQCFIEREHAMNDTPGSNLIPEMLEQGEYVQNGSVQHVSYESDDLLIAMNAPYEPDGTSWESMKVCGIPVPGCLTFYEDIMAWSVALRTYATHAQIDTIVSVYLIPKALIDLVNDCSVKILNTGDGTYTYYVFNGKGFPYTHGYNVSGRPTTIDGFTPVNGKLLTAPYIGLLLYNTAGSTNLLGYEYFYDPAAPVIRCMGVPTVGGNIYCSPVAYKGDPINFLEGISCGKFPSLGWSADLYTNWMTQNAVNLSLGLLGGAFDLGMGAVGIGAGSEHGAEAFGEGIKEIGNIIGEKYQRSLAPLTSRGMVNQGDVFTASGNNEVFVKPISITSQFAQRIDKYFTRFGYQTNQTKVANQLGRRYWNFVKIAPGESIGHSLSTDYFSVPASSMETINNIYRRGVTIWHDHANIGDYSLSNTIVS